MTTLSAGLVLASTVTHAYWNFLVKRCGGGTRFVGLSKVAEALLFAPAFAWWALPGGRGRAVAAAWPLVVGGAALTLAGYVALARAYRAGDLSLVYPIARGGTLIFLPGLGLLVFDERLSPAGWGALLCILLGIATLQRPRRSAGGVPAPAVLFALLAALAAAGYTVWDKRAVQALPPFAYFYAYTALVAAAYGAFLLRRYPRAELWAEWRANAWPIVQVAACNTASYLLVLVALRSGTSSYVIALRQLSIAFGALLGWRLLGEEMRGPRRLGVALVVAGCVLAAVAR